MHSLYNYLLAYENNKDIINAYLCNKSVENYAPVNQDLDKAIGRATSILGFSIGVFIFMALISLILWIWAVVILVKYWNQLPSWAQVLGIIGVLPILPGGTILTIIAVYIGKGQK